MALRVLLADNSETIKKVIQLTLKDFDIDLRVVTLGVDVLDVALQFNPDIIFVDILLQKKNGYEVSKELKNNVNLKNTPVVLMWSGFMELDEPKAIESLADGKIEKPFDADTLRSLVTALVQKKPDDNIEDFLEMPTKTAPKNSPKTASHHEDPLAVLDKINKESEKFKPIELPDLTEGLDEEAKPDSADEFEMQPLDKTTGFGYRESEQTKSFILDLPEDTNVDAIPMDVDNIENVEDMSFLLNPETAAGFKIPGKGAPATEPIAKVETPAPSAPKSDLEMPSAEDIEKLVREEVREAVEKVAWQVIPELAAEIIRKELDKLLKDNNEDDSRKQNP